MARLTPSGCRWISKPPTLAVPDVGSRRPQSIRMVVDFPAPLAPKKPKIRPRSTSKLTSSTAVKSPNFLVKAMTSMAYSGTAFLSRINGSLAKGFLEPGLGQDLVDRGLGPVHLRLK